MTIGLKVTAANASKIVGNWVIAALRLESFWVFVFAVTEDAACSTIMIVTMSLTVRARWSA